jgi:hypothetical protein
VLEKADEPLTGQAIELAMAGSEHKRAAVRTALARGISRGVIQVQPGQRRSILHTLPKPNEMPDMSSPSDSTDQEQTSMEFAEDHE